MKETVLGFTLRITADDPDAVVQALTQKLSLLKGVKRVDIDCRSKTAELKVTISFEDAEAAQKLHRKVINTLIRHEGVTVSQTSTTLTDIY